MTELGKLDMDRFKKLFSQYRAALAVLGIGILLLAFPAGEKKSPEYKPEQSVCDTFVLEEFEENLEEILSDLEGVGKCRVLLTIKGSSRNILAQDTQQEEGRLHTAPIILGRGAAQQEVVPLQSLTPEFRGALVACPGGDNPQVRLELSAAVSALTDLRSDRILICKST